jgi:hypothetical protein
MLNTQINRTCKATRLAGQQGLIQEQNEQLLLTYLLAVSTSDDASFATKAVVLKAIEDLKNIANAQAKSNTKSKGKYLLALERIKAPEKARPTQHVVIPPGAPIGDVQIGCTEY